MADDDDLDAWGSELDGKATPQVGMTRDVMHQARMLNPNLASQGSTTELLNKVKGAQPAPVAAQAPKVGLSQQPDLAGGLLQVQARYKESKARLQQEIAALQAQLKDVPSKALEQVVNLVIDIDPNMVSPQTHELFKSETAFLNEIGFTVRKVIDKKTKKR